MAEDNDPESKTEEATEKKIQDSLDKGQGPHSREAATLASMLGILIGVVFFVQDGLCVSRGTLETFLDQPSNYPLRSGADAAALLGALTVEIAQFIGPIVIVMAGRALPPTFSRISRRSCSTESSPSSNASHHQRLHAHFRSQRPGRIPEEPCQALDRGDGRLFRRRLFLHGGRQRALHGIDRGSGVMTDLVVRFLSGVVAAIAVLVGADIAWSRFSWHRDLRMTKQEVRTNSSSRKAIRCSRRVCVRCSATGRASA